MTDAANSEGGKPDWWVNNERLRRELGLPPYEPPRFDDGVPTHEVTSALEAEFACEIRFKGRNTTYPDDFTVYLDGEPAFYVGRHRDDNGNTVYELSASEFRELVREEVEGR